MGKSLINHHTILYPENYFFIVVTYKPLVFYEGFIYKLCNRYCIIEKPLFD
jgi:hypothetical protein